jgi:hypothetical protein
MGILQEPAAFVKALKLPEGFSVCELGNQMMSGGQTPKPAESFYRALGCGRYESIDGNGKGTLTADLNLRLAFEVYRSSVNFFEAFDLVTDFGTGEHIFDQAQVWRTLHELVKPGGYIAFDRPMHGYKGHCYYRVDPCLYRDVANANDYKVRKLDQAKTPRGELVRGVFQRPAVAAEFRVPQQGRYRESLVIG